MSNKGWKIKFGEVNGVLYALVKKSRHSDPILIDLETNGLTVESTREEIIEKAKEKMLEQSDDYLLLKAVRQIGQLK